MKYIKTFENNDDEYKFIEKDLNIIFNSTDLIKSNVSKIIGKHFKIHKINGNWKWLYSECGDVLNLTSDTTIDDMIRRIIDRNYKIRDGYLRFNITLSAPDIINFENDKELENKLEEYINFVRKTKKLVSDIKNNDNYYVNGYTLFTDKVSIELHYKVSNIFDQLNNTFKKINT